MTICSALAREDGITVIFVTHSVMESAYLSDRVLVMSAAPRPGRRPISLAAGRATGCRRNLRGAAVSVSAALLEAA